MRFGARPTLGSRPPFFVCVFFVPEMMYIPQIAPLTWVAPESRRRIAPWYKSILALVSVGLLLLTF